MKVNVLGHGVILASHVMSLKASLITRTVHDCGVHGGA